MRLQERERAGVQWIRCDKCQQWYHMKYVKMSKRSAANTKEWFCGDC